MTIIPKSEMFNFLYVMLKTILILLLILLVISIVTALYLATTITKPLARLESKMNQVSKGNMDVKMDIEQGEIGEEQGTSATIVIPVKKR